MKRLAVYYATTLFASLAAAPAMARPQPNPPPSGIVVHLFGPGSLTGNILPGTPAAQATNAPDAGGTQGAQAAAPAQSMDWGELGHELFVTGDPATEGPAVLAKGKSGQH
jgi:hypothetical protein